MIDADAAQRVLNRWRPGQRYPCYASSSACPGAQGLTFACLPCFLQADDRVAPADEIDAEIEADILLGVFASLLERRLAAE